MDVQSEERQEARVMADEQPDSALMVWLAPEGASTAVAAGRDFARALAGAPSRWFATALAEQEFIIHEAVRRNGFSDRKAQLAADAFDTGAWVEWGRIASTAQPETRGRA
jgi:hypothetical protein